MVSIILDHNANRYLYGTFIDKRSEFENCEFQFSFGSVVDLNANYFVVVGKKHLPNGP